MHVIPKFDFQGKTWENVSVLFGTYVDGSPAIDLLCEDGDPLARATVCLEGTLPGAGCVLIKEWSENAGMVKALTEAGVIEPTGMAITVNRWGSIAVEARVLIPMPKPR